MIKRFAYKDNTGKLHYRTRYTLENMKQTPGFSYVLLHWWSWDYWRIRTLHWRLKSQRISAVIDTNKKPVTNKKLMTQKVAFRDNAGKVHYRSNYTLNQMKLEPDFSYVLVPKWKRDYWKARAMAKKERQPINTAVKESIWTKRVVFVGKRGHVIYCTVEKLEKMKEKPGFTFEMVSRWHPDYWRTYLGYWLRKIAQSKWTQVMAVIIAIMVTIFTVLFILDYLAWKGSNSKGKWHPGLHMKTGV